MDIGSAVGRQRGISDEHLLALAEFRTSPLFTDREKVALEYAEEMCRQPVDVPEALFERVRAHFNEKQIIELTASIAFENYRARFNRALGVESDGLYVCALPPPGGKERAALTSPAQSQRLQP